MTDAADELIAAATDPGATFTLWQAPFVVIDVETTGLAHDGDDRVVEIAAVLFNDGAPTSAVAASRINPQRSIPAEATAIHGIGDAEVADAPTFDAFWPRIVELCSAAAYVVAFNETFDRAFARAETKRASIEVKPISLRRPWVDPFRWVQRFDRFASGKGRHRLGVTCERRGIALTRAHSADADAFAAGLLWLQLEREVRAFMGPEPVTLINVLRAQAAIAAEEEARFQEWKAKQPKPAA